MIAGFDLNQRDNPTV